MLPVMNGQIFTGNKGYEIHYNRGISTNDANGCENGAKRLLKGI